MSDTRTEIICPIVLRQSANGPEIMAFRHPQAGRQIIKGVMEDGDVPREVALRELKSDSGLSPSAQPVDLGKSKGIEQGEAWHFFACPVASLPDEWNYICAADNDQEYAFFWQKLDEFIDDSEWNPGIIRAFRFVQGKLERMDEANRARLLPNSEPELAKTILTFVKEHDGKSVDPSAIARHIAGSDEKKWRELMKPIRAEAAKLSRSGKVVLLRKGKPIEPESLRGIYKIKLA